MITVGQNDLTQRHGINQRQLQLQLMVASPGSPWRQCGAVFLPAASARVSRRVTRRLARADAAGLSDKCVIMNPATTQPCFIDVLSNNIILQNNLPYYQHNVMLSL